MSLHETTKLAGCMTKIEEDRCVGQTSDDLNEEFSGQQREWIIGRSHSDALVISRTPIIPGCDVMPL